MLLVLALGQTLKESLKSRSLELPSYSTEVTCLIWLKKNTGSCKWVGRTFKAWPSIRKASFSHEKVKKKERTSGKYSLWCMSSKCKTQTITDMTSAQMAGKEREHLFHNFHSGRDNIFFSTDSRFVLEGKRSKQRGKKANEKKGQF